MSRVLKTQSAILSPQEAAVVRAENVRLHQERVDNKIEEIKKDYVGWTRMTSEQLQEAAAKMVETDCKPHKWVPPHPKQHAPELARKADMPLKAISLIKNRSEITSRLDTIIKMLGSQ